jgi:hypothetical protein
VEHLRQLLRQKEAERLKNRLDKKRRPGVAPESGLSWAPSSRPRQRVQAEGKMRLARTAFWSWECGQLGSGIEIQYQLLEKTS